MTACYSPDARQDENQGLIRNQLFNNLLDGINLPADPTELMNLLGLVSETDKYYLAVVFSFEPMDLADTEPGLNWQPALRIQTIIQEELGKIAVHRSSLRDSNRIAVLLLMYMPGDEFRYDLQKTLETIEQRVAAECRMSLFAGVGLADNRTEGIVIGYRQACDALEQGRFFGSSFVCYFCDLYDRDSRQLTLSPAIKEQITKSLYARRFDLISQLIEQEFSRFNSLGLATRDNILSLKIDLTVFLMDLSGKLAAFAEMPQVFSRLISEFLAADSLPALEELLEQKLREIARISENAQEKRATRIVMDTKRLISDRISEPVNVQTLALMLKISPNYLSSLFRQETGQRLTEYIASVKMKHAAKLLLETDLRIGEITEAIGYENANYFSRIFRKQFGMNPSEYRHKK